MEEVVSMLNADVKEESSSLWASLVIIITRKDGTIFFCVNYRKLNDVTCKDAYPVPCIDDILGVLSSSHTAEVPSLLFSPGRCRLWGSKCRHVLAPG